MASDNTTGSPSSLCEPHKQHDTASNYKGLYGSGFPLENQNSKESLKSS